MSSRRRGPTGSFYYLSGSTIRYRIQPELVTVPKPRYEAREADFLTLHIEVLLPYENRTYWIDMEYEEPTSTK